LVNNIWFWLREDFKAYLTPLEYERYAERRSEDIPTYLSMDSYNFKVRYQLEKFLRRYTFEDEIKLGPVIEAKTNEKFHEIQRRVGFPLELSASTYRIVKRARKVIKYILGSFDTEEHERACSFSERATNGSKLGESYLELKLVDVSGSSDHIHWFIESVTRDNLLAEAVLGKPVRCDKLKQTLVPKTWNKRRPIMPNTTIGSFHSYGLGLMVQNRLQYRAGLDIRTLQEKHKVLARTASSHGNWVTLDLSSASENFGVDVVNMLTPREWFRQFNFGRIPYVELSDGSTIRLASFMGMGIGFTFTLQTLLFYGLIKAISLETGLKGPISVYGDDCIFHKNIYGYVRKVFTELRLVINEDKTFSSGPFRESCGGDYHSGHDVRPFMPEAVGDRLQLEPYLAFAYKLTNGLRSRWDDVEIPLTLQYLREHIRQMSEDNGLEVFYVPHSFPDYSGIKTDPHLVLPMSSDYRKVKQINGGFILPCLEVVPRQRVIVREICYYWRSMSSGQRERTKDLRYTKISKPKYIKAKDPKTGEPLFVRCSGGKLRRKRLLAESKRLAVSTRVGHARWYSAV
jgi:hypothetical protein